MKTTLLFVGLILMQFSSLAQSNPSVVFTKAVRVKDVACCGDRMSTIRFDYVYLFDQTGNISGRASCMPGWFSASVLLILIAKGPNFQAEGAKAIYFDKGSTAECKKSYEALGQISPDSPFVVDLLK